MKYVRFSTGDCTARDFEAKTYDQVNHSGLRISAWTHRHETWKNDGSEQYQQRCASRNDNSKHNKQDPVKHLDLPVRHTVTTRLQPLQS